MEIAKFGDSWPSRWYGPDASTVQIEVVMLLQKIDNDCEKCQRRMLKRLIKAGFWRREDHVYFHRWYRTLVQTR